MLVRQKDVAQRGQWDAGKDKLTCHTVAAVNHISGVVPDDDLGRGRTRFPRPWPTTRAEKDESRSGRLTFGCEWLRERSQ